MKLENWKNAGVSAALTFLAAFGGMGCLLTGMRLEANVVLLALGIAAMTAVYCIFFQTKKLMLIPFCLTALLLGYWWQEGTLRYSLEGAIYIMSDLYDRGYGWGIVQWSERSQLLFDATPALLLFALPTVIVVGLTVSKGSLELLGSGVALLPLLACLLLKDTVPAEGYLGILLFAVLLILLTQGVRNEDLAQGRRLTLQLSLPLLAGLLLLFLCCPQSTYDGQAGAQKLEDLVLELFRQEELPEELEDLMGRNGDQDKVVDLSRVGNREEKDDLIMTVKGQESGTVYLRGCAYDVYDGKSWSSTPGWNSWNVYYGSNSNQVKSLTIRTVEAHSVLYFTYAAYETERRVVGGRMRNEDQLKQYVVQYRDPIAYDPALDEKNDEIGGTQLAEYLQLPEETRIQAEKILRGRVGIPTETNNAGQIWRNAMLIAQWVSSRGKYDLNTPPMPESEADFALWFLEKGKSGYCTHYATATVVLLRAANIPAQYVTGYIVTLEKGKEVRVTSKQAHAWVEVFINGVGWVVLEPTPGYGSNPQQGHMHGETIHSGGYTTEPEQTGSTEPEQTVLTTETTEHAHSTEPGTTGEVTMPGLQGTESGSQPGTGIGGNGENKGGGLLMGLLWMLLAIVGVLVVLQWRLRVSALHAELSRGRPNQRALNRWALTERMAKLCGTEPSEESFAIAQKAAFSQHTVTAEELKLLSTQLDQLEEKLKKRNIFLQLVYTLVFALY